MLDITQYFFWQLVNFILLFVVLNKILFQPFMRLFEERKSRTTGALDEAAGMDVQTKGLLAQVDEKLVEARKKARTVFEGLSGEGLDVQKGVLAAAQKDAAEINRKAKEELRAAAEKARASLKSDIETFAKQIVDKLVGV